MTRYLLPLSLVATLGTGCLRGTTNNAFWFLFLPELAEQDCTRTVTTNYIGFVAYDDTSPGDPDWTITEEHSGTPEPVLVEIVDVSHTEYGKVLIWDDQYFFGLREGGAWVFRDTTDIEWIDQQVHDDGLRLYNRDFTMGEVRIDLDFKGSRAEGSVRQSSLTESAWEEDDTWDPAMTGHFQSIIPYSSYGEASDGGFAFNDPQMTDCSGNPCDLEVITDCETPSTPITGSRTDLIDEPSGLPI